jgi:hypothetical protein
VFIRYFTYKIKIFNYKFIKNMFGKKKTEPDREKKEDEVELTDKKSSAE